MRRLGSRQGPLHSGIQSCATSKLRNPVLYRRTIRVLTQSARNQPVAELHIPCFSFCDTDYMRPSLGDVSFAETQHLMSLSTKGLEKTELVNYLSRWKGPSASLLVG